MRAAESCDDWTILMFGTDPGKTLVSQRWELLGDNHRSGIPGCLYPMW